MQATTHWVDRARELRNRRAQLSKPPADGAANVISPFAHLLNSPPSPGDMLPLAVSLAELITSIRGARCTSRTASFAPRRRHRIDQGLLGISPITERAVKQVPTRGPERDWEDEDGRQTR